MKSEYVSGIRDEARQLRSALRRKLYQGKQKRRRIYNIVYREYLEFYRFIERWPVSEGMRNSKIIAEFLRANMILLVQLEQWLDRACKCSDEPLPPVPPVISTDGEWEEYLFELEDRMEEITRAHGPLYQSILVELLQVLDAFERLQSVPIPDIVPNTGADQPDCTCLRSAGERIYKHLLSALRRRGVKQIPLYPGDFPPVESTRIISRLDDSTSDSFVIDRIVEQGYTFKNQIFRKTAVIIKTSRKEQ